MIPYCGKFSRMVGNKKFTEITFVDCLGATHYEWVWPLIFAEKLSLISPKPRNLRKIFPSKVSRYVASTSNSCFYATGKHTIFGRVCSGITVVNKMGMVSTDSSDRCVI